MTVAPCHQGTIASVIAYRIEGDAENDNWEEPVRIFKAGETPPTGD